MNHMQANEGTSMGNESAPEDDQINHSLLYGFGADPEELRAYYSLTGAPRKDYLDQVTEADSDRAVKLGQARADAHRAMLEARAAGIRSIGEALNSIGDTKLAMKIVELDALERIASSLANGKATKLFLPRELGQIAALLASGGVVTEEVNND